METWPSRRGEVDVFIFDKTYQCSLRLGELMTLEERTKSTIGDIWNALDNGSWKVDHLLEITRLGLIGGGMDAEDAATLLNQTFRSGQIMRFTACAARILSAALVGVVEDDEVSKGEPRAPASSPSTGAQSSASPRKRATRPPKSGG